MTQPAAQDRFDVAPSVGNHFAWMRTQLGLQRTLMAGVRTSVSLIGFGFTVAQFFERLQSNAERARLLGPEVPRNLGLVLIAAGVISLAVFTEQYRNAIAYLRGGPFGEIALTTDKSMHRSVYFVALVVLLIGLAAFVSVLARF